ncbi:SMR domain-containing protein At5g58720-like isoform X1 [Papaver somniferum]|uniref:SMR domain-containing protein At5g58720-like isoform X1 n=1 Tax=Papaver somniferum TaxID=3469 RepID=UPI000E703851|nr:SMR domain-containing protein At5g58720-like isoform X1 [Papaver somniferum]
MVRKKKKPQKVNGDGESKEERDVKCLAEAFSLVSLEEVNSAYKEAQGDSNKAAEILSDLMMNTDNDSFRGGACSSSTSSSFFESSSNNSEERMTSSSSSSSEMFWESDIQRTHDSSGMGFVDCKAKRVVATAGTVSGVIGKDYVRSSPLDKERGRGGGGGEQHYNSPKWKNTCMVNGVSVGNEEAEQFLFSMLGDGCDLSMAVVRDVFCQCGYDVEKVLSVLFLEF